MALKNNRLLCVLMLCAAFFSVLLSGCAGSAASVDDASPQAEIASATIASSSQMTEETQLVELTIPFDKPLVVEDGAVQDLNITLDGKELDSKTVQVSVEAKSNNLVLRIAPAQTAGSLSSGTYFALYQGSVIVKAANNDGSLAHIKGESGSAAVLSQQIEALAPSGMKIKGVSADKSSCVVKVIDSAQLRCCTWFDLAGERFFMHHHAFYQETPSSCAKALAEQVNASFSGVYKAKAQGDKVTIKALKSAQSPSLKIVEGIGA